MVGILKMKKISKIFIKINFLVFIFTATYLHSNSNFVNDKMEKLGEGIFIMRNIKPEANQKIAIATVIISGKNQEVSENYSTMTYAKGVALGTKSKKLYAKRYGYDFIIATQKLNTCFGHGTVRPLECAWTKLALISRILKNYDWVFWSDADSVILNFDIKLEDFLNPNYDIIACSQNTGFSPRQFGIKALHINTGEVFYKNSDFSKFIIEEAWKNHKKKTPGSFEQARINALIKSLPKSEMSKVLVYPASAFNTPTRFYKEGDFMLHMYAYHGRELYKKFKEIKEKYGWIIKNEENKQNFYQN